MSGSVRTWACALAAVAASACGAAPHPPVPGAQPNVVIFLVDALRRDHVGAYGYELPTTPVIDELAREGGVVFERAYAQAPQTFNSTATLLTSRYFPILRENPDFREIPGLAARLQNDFGAVPLLVDANRTLAEVFRAAGYRTAAIFTNPHHHATSGFAQGFEHAPYLPPRISGQAHAVAHRVNDSLQGWLRESDPGRPLFAYVHYMDVHNPYRPPERFARMFVHREGTERYMNDIPRGNELPGPEDLAFMKESYDAEIRYVDTLLGRAVEAVRATAPHRPSIFVVASDHGEEFLDHGGLGHGKTLELEMLHVPLILAGDMGLDQSLRVAQPVRNLDIGPTLLELSGVEIPGVFEGRSLVPRIRAAQPASVAGAIERVRQLLERVWTKLLDQPRGVDLRRSSYAWLRTLRSLTTERWHLIHDLATDERRLYELANDPLGFTNVADHHPRVVAALSEGIAALESQLRETVALGRALSSEGNEGLGEGGRADPRIVEQLRALGYLEPAPE